MTREVRPRDYWVHFSVELADNEDLRRDGKKIEEYGLGFGSRMNFENWSGTWLTDEQIDKLSAQNAKFMARYMKEMRDREIARAQEAAKTFWQRWLGA